MPPSETEAMAPSSSANSPVPPRKTESKGRQQHEDNRDAVGAARTVVRQAVGPAGGQRSDKPSSELAGKQPLRGLKRYKMVHLVGDGTYGLVYLATNMETKDKVAIKTMKRKYHSWNEVMDLREVKSLKKLNHPNVVKLKEVIRENSRLYFVFEYIKGDLLGLMRENSDPLPESSVRSIIFQVLQALAYMHRNGFFHRDLKPENILCSSPELVKIADFGLAREIRSSPPYTDYVSTRWYRAPEVLLRSTVYSSPIDVWAVGCIMAELYTKRPLFPGSSEIDQIYKVCSILGTPSHSDWQQGHQLATAMNFKFPRFSPTHLSQVLQSGAGRGVSVGARAISLIYSTLTWNPAWRSSAQESLKHSYFRVNSQPNSASSTSHLNFSLKPSRSRKAVKADHHGERATVPIVPVEPVYEREGLRNYREDPVQNNQDHHELKHLLDTLQANDVMPVDHRKNKHAGQSNGHHLHMGSAKNKIKYQPPTYGHQRGLNAAGRAREPAAGPSEVGVQDSPGRFSFAKMTGGEGSMGLMRAGNKVAKAVTGTYFPSFGFANRNNNNNGLNGLSDLKDVDKLIKATALFADHKTVIDKTFPEGKDKVTGDNGEYLRKDQSFILPRDTNDNPILLLGNGGIRQNALGDGLEAEDSNRNGIIRPTRVSFGAATTKVDISARVVESFSDFHLSGNVGDGTAIIDYDGRRNVHKVQSLPNIKSESLLVGRKAIHDRSPYTTYVPSQIDETGEQNSTKSIHVRTDWKAKYLT